MFPELELREGWVTVFCLLLMSLSVAWAIQAAGWTDGLAILQGMVLLGGVAGIVLAKSRVPNRLAHLLSILAGWTWAVYLTSQVLTRTIGLSVAMAVVKLDSLFRAALRVPFTQGASADNHVFLLLLAFLLWVMAYFCAWAVFRWQRVWWATILCGVALLVNISATSKNLTPFLILFLLSALLLVVRASLAIYEQEWRAAHVGYSSELIFAFLRAGLIFSVLVILLAWLAPSALASRPLQPFWDKVGEPWRQFEERSARLFQDLNYQNEPPMIIPAGPRTWFGGPVNLPHTPVADVAAASGHYWRVMVFHEYLGNGWRSNDSDTMLIGPNEPALAFPELAWQVELTQTVTLQRDWAENDALIAAAQPLSVGLPIRARVSYITYESDSDRYPDPSSAPSALGDPSALLLREPLEAGDAYQVLSSVSDADVESMRRAGTDYPNWVASRYLQLPESFPRRVRLLAEEITSGLEMPYDKANAIETYLRQIPYDTQIAGPGLGQDGVEYFLFDARAGYCDYYASAMVVMLRAVGVPARYVVGYSQQVKESGLYRLLASDAHAWPEVFFPGYGWVEFEPTGGRTALVRPLTHDVQAEAQGPIPTPPISPLDRDRLLDLEAEEDVGGPALAQTFWQRIGWWVWLALALLVVAGAGIALLAVRRRRQVEGLSVAERVYEDLVAWSRRLLGLEPLAHHTPYEYAGIVVRQVPRGRAAVERIAGLYVEERFSARPAAESDAEVAWRQAWPALWHRWLERRLRGLRRFWWRLVPPRESQQAEEIYRR